MDLLTPNTGLIIWQLIIFLGLVLLLKKFAWRPILASLKQREDAIQGALDAAEKAKIEISTLKADNEKLFKEAREERDRILSEARQAANRIHEEAQAQAKKNADSIIEDAKAIIQSEKQAVLRDVKAQVAAFSFEITEKLLRKNLTEDKQQKELVETYLKELKFN